MSKKVKIVAVGKIKEKYILEGICEYKKRLKPFCDLEIVEIKKSDNILKEEKKIESHINDHTFILDCLGKGKSSEHFSKIFKSDHPVTFIIGGSEGFSSGFKKNAKLISLSEMTFLHEMARLILLEQIYRGFMILNNRAYHK